MSLSAGHRRGIYEVVGALGAGGMGEVYRARDSKLNRHVAVKVLPELFALDAERLARFTREAQTLAALNHPNIAQIYGLEGDGAPGSTRALIMELVDGDDLSVLIARGAMPLAEALPIARQIADALEAAHEQGIVHRDLKPANVKVRHDGTVKVLDFGLAKAMDPAGSYAGGSPHASPAIAPTLTGLRQGLGPASPGTQMGMIIGTAAYMSPEQARGKTVDKRADIWAFGVVLYEMLTGRRAFGGDDMSDVLASVLKTEPDWQAVPVETPAAIRRLLRRCLEKEPRKRLSAIGDARLELDETEPAAGVAPASPQSRRPSIGTAMTGGLVAIAVLAAAGIMWFATRSGSEKPNGVSTHLSIALPDGDEVTDKHMLPLAISPDGTRVAYIALHNGVRQMFLRNLTDAEATIVAGTETARSPFFSPDGQWIGFFAEEKVKKVTVGSGAVQIVTGGAQEPRGATWGSDGNIYYTPSNMAGVWKVAASGGTGVEVTRLDVPRGEISHRWPQILPNGELMFSSWTGAGPDEHTIGVQSLATGERYDILSVGDTPRYAGGSHLTYGRLDTLIAVPWRLSKEPLTDVAPISLPEQPRLENEGAADYAVSDTGTLAYIAGGPARYRQRIVWVDRLGNVEPLPIPERDYEAVTLSPDGQRAIVQIREGKIGLWLFEFTRKTLTPLATAGGSSQGALWSADGSRVIYRGTRGGTRNLYWRAADGSGEEERLTTKPAVNQTPSSVSSDGEWLVFSEGSLQSRGTLWLMRLRGDRTPRELLRSAANGQISPDGRWLAYQSTTSGQLEVYVVPFPGPGARVAVSANGGENPLWSNGGRELFYISRDEKTMVVSITPGTTLSVSAPRVLYEGRYRPGSNTVTPFDISRDGRRFLRVQQVQPDRPVTRIDIVLNWLSELRK